MKVIGEELVEVAVGETSTVSAEGLNVTVATAESALALPAASSTAFALSCTVTAPVAVGITATVKLVPLPVMPPTVPLVTVRSFAARPVTASLKVRVKAIGWLVAVVPFGAIATVGATVSKTTAAVFEAVFPALPALCAALALTVRLTAPCPVGVTGTVKVLGPPVIVPAVPLAMVRPPAPNPATASEKLIVKAMGAVWVAGAAEVTVTLGVVTALATALSTVALLASSVNAPVTLANAPLRALVVVRKPNDCPPLGVKPLMVVRLRVPSRLAVPVMAKVSKVEAPPISTFMVPVAVWVNVVVPFQICAEPCPMVRTPALVKFVVKKASGSPRSRQ